MIEDTQSTPEEITEVTTESDGNAPPENTCTACEA